MNPTPTTPSSSPASAFANSPVISDARFHSAALGREMSFRIYLPHAYQASTARYPVLYLLHGIYGTFENWDQLTRLPTYAKGMDWIIVMPDAGNSWYVNSATVPEDRFEDYIANDLMAEIDARYRTITTRHARAIAGLSMGGYAAMKLALRNPQRFGFAGSLSGAFDAARNLDEQVAEFAPKLLEVFGAAGNPARAHNDLFELLAKAMADLPHLYLACGIADSFLSVNRQYVADLSARHVLYEYHETPGGHDWDYWDREIQPLLAALQKTTSRDRE
jgi:putative tributyrin esterase